MNIIYKIYALHNVTLTGNIGVHSYTRNRNHVGADICNYKTTLHGFDGVGTGDTRAFGSIEASVNKHGQVVLEVRRASCRWFGGCSSADVAFGAWQWLASLLSISTFIFIPTHPIEDTKCAVLFFRDVYRQFHA